MRVVIQLVKEARVRVAGDIVGEIGKGLLVLVGFEEWDVDEDMEWIGRKLMQMRIFKDEQNKMNLSIQDVQGEVLLVSQFTLYASTKKGNTPSFINAAAPDKARGLYEKFVRYMKETYERPIASGVFGAMMEVELINDGPVTITMDSKMRE